MVVVTVDLVSHSRALQHRSNILLCPEAAQCRICLSVYCVSTSIPSDEDYRILLEINVLSISWIPWKNPIRQLHQ